MELHDIEQGGMALFLRESGARARLRQVGVDALTDVELLTLLLTTGLPGETTETLAARMLAELGGARSLMRAGLDEISHIAGTTRAARVTAALELARRAMSVPLSPSTPWSSSRNVVRAFAPRLAHATEECVMVVLLDARNRPIAERRIATGGPASCNVNVRSVFALAVREGASAFVMVHNHPSGDATPSREDIALTASMAAAGKVLELPLLDHVIVAREGSFSFLDAGMLGTEARAA